MAESDIVQKHYFDLERIDIRSLFAEPNYETIVYALSQQGTDFSKKVLIASSFGELGSGGKFENAVFNQLMHKGEVAYYQLKTGREIDFILDKSQCFEVKETATESDLKNVQSLAQNLKIDTSYVIGRHPSKIFDGFIWGGFLR